MKQFILTGLFIVLSTVAIWAQQTDVPVAMYVEGEVWYENGGARSRVYTGTKLSTTGQLTLSKNSAIELIHNEKFVKLNKAGKHDLTALVGGGQSGDNFVKRFSNFVSNGLDQSASNKNLEQSYQKNQGNARGNIRGYTDAGLAGLLPIGGNLSPALTTFTWPEGRAGGYYEFQIVDSLSDELVLLALSDKSSWPVDLRRLHMEAGRTYFWEVYYRKAATAEPTSLGGSNDEEKTPRLSFRVVPNRQQMLIDEVRKEAVYRDASGPAQKLMIEAMVLEDGGFLYAADELYRKGLTAEANNLLLKRSYAAFLARQQQVGSAKAILGYK